MRRLVFVLLMVACGDAAPVADRVPVTTDSVAAPDSGARARARTRAPGTVRPASVPLADTVHAPVKVEGDRAEPPVPVEEEEWPSC